ncbi:MAG: cytochrome c-type biogenesis protein CcmH [Proteobacteria bacterium]|nr:cytochrome c-type biogenesis protein CcmH [Pseudomonadota bacterium]
MKLFPAALGLLASLVLSATALAVQPDEILKDATLEARARSISAGLRCLVCQNQSIDDSDAPVARDLRILIREQLTQNKSDAEVVDFVVARYGDFVLLKPPLRLDTLLLWGGPFLILAVGGLFLWRRRAPSAAVEQLTADEQAELDRLLKQ